MSDLPPFPGYDPERPGLPVGNDPLFGPPRPPPTPDYGDYPYEITIYNQWGEPFSNSAEGWYQESLGNKDALMNYYGMDNIDIVWSYIQAMQMIDPDFQFDWQTWRDDYAAAHAGAFV